GRELRPGRQSPGAEQSWRCRDCHRKKPHTQHGLRFLRVKLCARNAPSSGRRPGLQSLEITRGRAAIAPQRGGTACRYGRFGGPQAIMIAAMTVYTDYLWFNTSKRREVVRITDDVASIVSKSGVREGMVLVSAMRITACVYVNDWESGLSADMQDW